MSGPVDVDKLLKQMLLKDLRIQCRARGLSPAGGKEQLSERLKEHMLATSDFAMRSETGEVIGSVDMKAGLTTDDVEGGCAQNNYSRPDGQNCGNFLTDRPSSRVLAAPGGGSSIVFGDDAGSTIPAPAAVRAMPPTPVAAPVAAAAVAVSAAPAAPAPGSLAAMGGGNASNNYSRPDGQNCGNFLTDRKTVKVAAPPGGASQITFG